MSRAQLGLLVLAPDLAVPRAEMQLPEEGPSPGDAMVAGAGRRRAGEHKASGQVASGALRLGHEAGRPPVNQAPGHVPPRGAGHLQAPRGTGPRVVTPSLWQGLKCVVAHFLAFRDNVRCDGSRAPPHSRREVSAQRGRCRLQGLASRAFGRGMPAEGGGLGAEEEGAR